MGKVGDLLTPTCRSTRTPPSRVMPAKASALRYFLFVHIKYFYLCEHVLFDVTNHVIRDFRNVGIHPHRTHQALLPRSSIFRYFRSNSSTIKAFAASKSPHEIAFEPDS